MLAYLNWSRTVLIMLWCRLLLLHFIFNLNNFILGCTRYSRVMGFSLDRVTSWKKLTCTIRTIIIVSWIYWKSTELINKVIFIQRCYSHSYSLLILNIGFIDCLYHLILRFALLSRILKHIGGLVSRAWLRIIRLELTSNSSICLPFRVSNAFNTIVLIII